MAQNWTIVAHACVCVCVTQTNFTSLATPNQVGSGKTALVTLLHEGGHAAHFANILQVCRHRTHTHTHSAQSCTVQARQARCPARMELYSGMAMQAPTMHTANPRIRA